MSQFNYAYWCGKGEGTIKAISWLTKDIETKAMCEKFIEEYEKAIKESEV